MSQYLALVQRVRQETGTAGTGPTTVVSQSAQLAQLVTWTAQAYLDVCNKWDDYTFLWAEDTATLVADTRDYTLAGDLRAMNEDSLYLFGGDLPAEGQKLDYIEYDLFRRNKVATSETGVPSCVTRLPSGEARLIPTPDDSYTFEYEYWREPVPLSGDTSTPEFSSLYEDCIIWRACWYWASFNEAQLEAAAFNFNFEQAMLRLEARYLPSSERYHARSEGADLVVRAE